MDKKMYNKPELTVVKLTAMPHLLAGSPYESGGGEGGDSGSKNSKTSRSTSFSTLDIEE